MPRLAEDWSGAGRIIYTFNISPDGYIPGAKRGKFSKTLQQWRWISALQAGRHTLTVNFGGKTYGPVTFEWKDAPLLYD